MSSCGSWCSGEKRDLCCQNPAGQAWGICSTTAPTPFQKRPYYLLDEELGKQNDSSSLRSRGSKLEVQVWNISFGAESSLVQSSLDLVFDVEDSDHILSASVALEQSPTLERMVIFLSPSAREKDNVYRAKCVKSTREKLCKAWAGRHCTNTNYILV